jgi:hypothetical protein
MRLPAGGAPLRWCVAIARGLYRSTILTALTWLMPAVCLTVGLGGSHVVRSWSEGLSAPLVVRALVALGQTLMVILWITVAVWVVHPLASRPLAKSPSRAGPAD